MASEVSNLKDEVAALRTEISVIHAENSSLRDMVKSMRNGIYALAGVGLSIGIGALIMVGAYKEKVDTTTKEVAAVKITLQSVQLQMAGVLAASLRTDTSTRRHPGAPQSTQ